ncbi:hypothetical protein X752_04240 [Mesorhizobium sp. LNJC398B00]|nr:hypothetical protein X752_04240 [Mesorhizobium sp. LNJC398B00]
MATRAQTVTGLEWADDYNPEGPAAGFFISIKRTVLLADVLFLSLIIQFVEIACFAAVRMIRLIFGTENPDSAAFHPTDWASEIASIVRPVHFQAPVRKICGLEYFGHLSQAFVGFGDLVSQGFPLVHLC